MKSPYKELILEKLRALHAQEEMLYSILNEVERQEKEGKKNGKTDSNNG